MTSFGVFCVNICSVVGCRLIEEPPKNEQKTSHPRGTAVTYSGSRNPEPIATKFCMYDVITRANFCADLLRGFGMARGRILAIFHWLALSPLTLSHYRASVRFKSWTTRTNQKREKEYGFTYGWSEAWNWNRSIQTSRWLYVELMPSCVLRHVNASIGLILTAPAHDSRCCCPLTLTSKWRQRVSEAWRTSHVPSWMLRRWRYC